MLKIDTVVPYLNDTTHSMHGGIIVGNTGYEKYDIISGSSIVPIIFGSVVPGLSGIQSINCSSYTVRQPGGVVFDDTTTNKSFTASCTAINNAGISSNLSPILLTSILISNSKRLFF